MRDPLFVSSPLATRHSPLPFGLALAPMLLIGAKRNHSLSFALLIRFAFALHKPRAAAHPRASSACLRATATFSAPKVFHSLHFFHRRES